MHGAMLTLAGIFGVYNAAAWWRRREPHLAMNAAVYAALVVYEVRNVVHHCGADDARP